MHLGMHISCIELPNRHCCLLALLPSENPEALNKEELWKPQARKAVPEVDLEYEYDHDDPDAADKEELWKVPPTAPIPNVDLDDELDL
jgi:hypothetical protein